MGVASGRPYSQERRRCRFFRDYQIPEDTHLREGDPHRSRPAEVFASATPADDYQMVLMPAADKSKRLALLAETHLIKGGSETPAQQPAVAYPYLNIYQGKEASLCAINRPVPNAFRAR